MSNLESKDLTQAKKLIKESRYDKALEFMRNTIQKEDITNEEKITFQRLRAQIFFWQGKHEEAIKLGEQIYEEAQYHNDILQSFEGLFFICKSLSSNQLMEFNKALDVIKQAERLLKQISEADLQGLKQKEGQLASIKAWIYSNIGEIDQAKKNLEYSFRLLKNFSIEVGEISPYYCMATILVKEANLDLALDYTEQGISIAQTIQNPYLIGIGYIMFGLVSFVRGEYKLSINYNKKSLTVFENLKNEWWRGALLTNIGEIYSLMGEFDLALGYYKRSLLILEIVNPMRLAFVFDGLINIALENGDYEQAQQYFQRLKHLTKQRNDKETYLLYKFNKASILKTSSRIRNRAKAEELFKSIIKEDSNFELKIKVLINICDLLFMELQMTSDSEVLKEIHYFVNRLSVIAEKSNSFWVLGETFLMQAKIALLSFDLKVARSLLTKGQKIAEKYGIRLLAMKISNEHDELLNQLNNWQNLKESNASIAERIELSRMNDQMKNMVQKRIVTPEETSDEEPVVILIISKGGKPIFSQSFAEGWSFEDHLFGGFLSAINSFSDEVFSQGLDRAIFGEYTIIMNAISSFIICYLFKGQSYLAQQRIKHFIDTLQNDKKIWEIFNKYYQTNQIIQAKDIPSLDLLVNEIFIEKSI